MKISANGEMTNGPNILEQQIRNLHSRIYVLNANPVILGTQEGAENDPDFALLLKQLT